MPRKKPRPPRPPKPPLPPPPAPVPVEVAVNDSMEVEDMGQVITVVLGDSTIDEPPAPEPEGFYGPMFGMDAIGNQSMGGAGPLKAAYGFIAEQTSTLTAIRFYFMFAAGGYGAGTGGTIRTNVQTESGGIPSGTVISSTDDIVPGPQSNAGYLHTFATPANLTAGTKYFIVYENIDPSPTVNYISLNSAFQYSASTITPTRQPEWDNFMYSHWHNPSGVWTNRNNYNAILELTYGNGQRHGQGYMEVEASNWVLINGTTSMARERFTVTGGDRVISDVHVRLGRRDSASVGNLLVRLEDSTGTLIDSCSIPTTSLPVSSSNYYGAWISGSFSALRTLTSGQTYHLRLSTDSSTNLWFRGQQDGSNYGYTPASHFSDGYLQRTTNGGATWATVAGLDVDGDMAFYFTVVTP